MKISVNELKTLFKRLKESNNDIALLYAEKSSEVINSAFVGDIDDFNEIITSLITTFIQNRNICPEDFCKHITNKVLLETDKLKNNTSLTVKKVVR